MPVTCVCVIVSEDGKINGKLVLTQDSEDAETHIKGQISGLSKGKHAIAIHVFGDISEGGKRIGGHFNPFGKNHGSPGDADRHVGSLGTYDHAHTCRCLSPPRARRGNFLRLTSISHTAYR